MNELIGKLRLMTRRRNAQPAFALFNLGFRPFFLLAGITSLLLIPVWILVYATGDRLDAYYQPVLWHGHEMIFGYSMAVIAGFLLTAVGNWTGIDTPRGKALAALAGLWLAGRIAPLLSGILPAWLIGAVDAAFAPVLALTLAVPLIRKRQTHNLVFLFALAALTLANLMVHGEMAGVTGHTAARGLLLGVYLVVMLITILGGRVIPFFTEMGIPGATTRQNRLVDGGSIGALIALVLLDLGDAPLPAVALAAGASAVLQGLRLCGWYHPRIWSVPLLWVLHLAYAWLVAGFLLKALSALVLVNPLLTVHAFTTGAIGTITLGMMARVSQGHTGRTLYATRAMTRAFVLVNLAAVARVFLPLLAPDHYLAWLVLAALCWSLAFATFVYSFTPVLLRPRIDGRPG